MPVSKSTMSLKPFNPIFFVSLLFIFFIVFENKFWKLKKNQYIVFEEYSNFLVVEEKLQIVIMYPKITVIQFVFPINKQHYIIYNYFWGVII